MDFLKTMHISGTGLTAQRTRMNVISQNLANASTTRTERGGPYTRKIIVMEEAPSDNFDAMLKARSDSGRGVRVTGIVEDRTPHREVYQPGHPDADSSGFVKMPNVDPIAEMTNMTIASRSYEANVAAVSATKGMALKALEIGK